MLLKKQFSFFLSSDPESGAQNVAIDGSSFSVNLNSPIMIPARAVSAELSVIQANIWNDSANISVDDTTAANRTQGATVATRGALHSFASLVHVMVLFVARMRRCVLPRTSMAVR